MARQLKPGEAEVFEETTTPEDTETFLRHLAEKQEHPLDLSIPPGLWFRGFPLDPSGF